MAEEKEDSKTEDSDKDILEDAKKGLKTCIDEQDTERLKMEDDLRFCTLDQWPADIRKDRENDLENGPRPCLTIDKINQYIVQVVNDFRQGKPGINVRPMDDGADVETAKVLKGLVRNIEDQSNADIAYATAVESAAKIGVGYFRITTEYVEDSFNDQEIFIKPIPNSFSVYMGSHIMPDGSDCKECFIVDSMSVEEFKEKYPGKKWKQDEFEGLGGKTDYWHSGERVTLVEYLCLEKIDQTILLLADGTSITQKEYDSWPPEAGVKPTIQNRRPGFKEQLKWSKLTGCDVLEKQDLPGKYIPVVEVIGRESTIDGKRILWGLVRPAKDSLRMYNYFASTITEKMGLAPKAPFVGAVGQFATKGDQWRKANKINYAYLEYDPIDVNGNALPRPERQGPTPMETALLHQMQVIEHDVQTSLGMFKAAVGETESQQSGRALLALQKQSDTGTYHFGANGGISIRHCGRIIVDMIPHYYDTKRVVRILGEDGSVDTAHLDPNQEQSRTHDGIKSIYNPNVGKYDVSITVGPSYNTKRMETAATLTEVLKGNPNLMPIMGDLFFRSLDFPYSDQIAERMKMMLPPQLQKGANPQAIAAQLQQKLQILGQQMQEIQQENVQLKAGAQVGMAKVQVEGQSKQQQSQIALQDLQATFNLQKQKQDGELQLAREKADAEIRLKFETAQAEIELKKIELQQASDNVKDKAIGEVANLSEKHLMKMEAVLNKNTEGEGKTTPEDTVAVQALQHEFMKTVGNVVKGLASKKSINMTLPDGRKATAEVSSDNGGGDPFTQMLDMHKQKLSEVSNKVDQPREQYIQEQLMPQMVQPMVEALKQIGQVLQQSMALQEQTLAVLKAPKSTSIKDVKFGPDGTPTSATVNSRPLLN